MLSSLMIKNFAIIDDIHIDFDDHMTILTGETGAGKSIIIDAIGLLLGHRASSFMVKSGQPKAVIEGVFDISDALRQLLLTFGFEVEDDLVLYREILSNGKSIAKLNYRTISISLLKQISPYLVDIHSQFETQELLKEDFHLTLLDRYGHKEISLLLNQYEKAFHDYKQIKKQYDALLKVDGQEEERDFYQAKIDEINQVDLETVDIDSLENEKKQMSDFEKTNDSLSQVLSYLTKDQGCSDQLYQADYLLSHLDLEELKDVQDRLSNVYYQLNDIIEELDDIKEGLFFDPYRYEEITQQLMHIKKLQRQYGYEPQMILEKRQEFLDYIDLIDHREERLAALKKQLDDQYTIAYDIAYDLHQARVRYATLLETQMETQLKDLCMEQSVFKVSFDTTAQLKPKGIDQVVFMVSTNKGQSLSHLSDIASGGELSRLMLAMKCLFTEISGVSTIIFDEVDTGVSGKVAFAIGRKMKQLSLAYQVLCITHLPQVASFADHHLYVYKTTELEITQTKVSWLNKDERIKEIAKMLSNDFLTEEALLNASTLIAQSSKEE